MKRLLVGECSEDNVLLQSDPDALSEAEFEWHVARVLTCFYRAYHCIIFAGTFRYDDRGYRPDLALVARDYSHWFVIEVEIASHSLDLHVLPQVRGFQFGQPSTDCSSIFARDLNIAKGQAQALVSHVPRSVVVISNKVDETWRTKLSALQVQMASVSVYSGRDGRVAYELEGTLDIMQESLGFGRYSATDRSLRFPKTVRLPRGRIQIDDPSGGLGWWDVTEGDNQVWVTKETGMPSSANGSVLQIVRMYNGRLVLRWPQ